MWAVVQVKRLLWKTQTAGLVGLPRIHNDRSALVVELKPMEIRTFVVELVEKEAPEWLSAL